MMNQEKVLLHILVCFPCWKFEFKCKRNP